MSRLIITYSIFSVLLFGALFAAFFISGLGAPGEAWDAPEAAEAAANEAALAAPDRLAAGLDHPALEPGRTYRVSHVTKMYPEPDTSSSQVDSIAARGLFTVVLSVDTDVERWYLVTAGNWAEGVSRYILAKDLNFKRVTPQYSADEQEAQRLESTMKLIEEMGAQRRAARLAAAPPPEPEERTPETFSEWWAMTADRIGGAQSATIVVSAVAAVLGTALTIGSMFLVTTLRREHTWDRPAMQDLDAEWQEARHDDTDVHAGTPPNDGDERW